ncbi:MAG: ABC transporter permease [Candidatus Binatia bacterium]
MSYETENQAKVRKLLKISLRSLSQHKFRSILSALGIIFGVVAVIAMLSIGEGAKRETLAQIEQLGTNNIILRSLALTEAQELAARERLSRGLSLYDVQRIREGAPGIAYVALLTEVKAALVGAQTELNPEIVATTETYREIRNLTVAEGRFLSALDVEQKNLVCVIGWNVASSLGPGGRVGQSIRIENEVFRVIGVLQHRNWIAAKSPALADRNFNRMVIIPLGTDRSLVAGASLDGGGMAEISVRVKTGDNVASVAKVIKTIVERAHGGVEDYHMIVPQELLNQARRTHRMFNIVLGSIAGISLLVGGIGIMNIMLANVFERTKEIGIRRALGANRTHIVVQFLSEAILLTLSGGLIGIVLGVGGAKTISLLTGWSTIITGWALFLSIGMSLAVGIFFGLYPAYKASMLDPIVALRYE